MAMFENIGGFFKRFMQNEKKELLVENTTSQSKETAKDRLHVVLMQDRANVSADFLEMMKEEIIEVIKKYIVVDESKIDVRLTNEENEDGSIGVPLLHANIPILNIRNDLKGELSNNNPESEEVLKDNADNMDKTQIIQVVREQVDNDDNSVEIEEKQEDTIIVEDKNELDSKNSIENEDSSVEEENQSENNEENETVENVVEENVENNEDTKKEPITLEEKIDELEDDFEEDDDVTFDDLLKAAEEEERLKELEQNKTEEENKESIDTEKEEENIEKEKSKAKKKSTSSVKKKKTSKSKKK